MQLSSFCQNANSFTVRGIPYDPALDMWSVGCTLYKLYIGKILFPGQSNNQMLLLMVELKGRFNNKMVKKAKFGDVYFDEMGRFESVEKDWITGNVSHRFPCINTLPVTNTSCYVRMSFVGVHDVGLET